jgi:glycosyltransferase involved in cell wall biosynthesis
LTSASTCGFIGFGNIKRAVRNNLNVAMVVRNFSPAGGLELYTHKVIEGLLDRGHRVTVFCQSVETGLQHQNLSIQRMQPRPANITKVGRMEHDYSVGNQALQSANHFDIIHSQHYPVAKANVVTFHNHAVLRWSAVGLPWEKLINETKFRLVTAYKIRDFQDRMLCAGAECLVFPSHIMQRDYYESYPFLQKCEKPYVVAYPGSTLSSDSELDEKKSSAVIKPKPNGSDQRFSFLFVGRGYRRKGLDILLSACSKLAKERHDFRLLIAGLQAKPLDEARLVFMGLDGTVQYLGFQHDMARVYAQAQAAILPSRIEPFGMAPLQAMECGLVPIVSRVSGASEVLQNGFDSLILENHLDATELARLMRKLIDDPVLLGKLSAGARRTAKNVNWQQTVDNTLRAYDLVVTRANTGFAAAVK